MNSQKVDQSISALGFFFKTFITLCFLFTVPDFNSETPHSSSINHGKVNSAVQFRFTAMKVVGNKFDQSITFFFAANSLDPVSAYETRSTRIVSGSLAHPLCSTSILSARAPPLS